MSAIEVLKLWTISASAGLGVSSTLILLCTINILGCVSKHRLAAEPEVKVTGKCGVHESAQGRHN